jgi:16S rRNA (cytosine1402-N4)-methyltransferase
MVAVRMNEGTLEHQPVLLQAVLENLAITSSGVYVDATFGRGGHAKAILNRLGPTGRLLAMDKDPEAISFACQHFFHDTRFTIQQGSFKDLHAFLAKQNLEGKVDGILFDLGVSSPQLNDAKRGFSFLHTGPLDMRMDNTKGISAAAWIAKVGEKELATVLWEYGEERFARRIAHAIIKARGEKPITETLILANIIAKAHPAWQKGKHPATKSFQAIRIKINDELKDLHEGLAESKKALKIGGRLCVISFHSLEDRIVKHFIQPPVESSMLHAPLPIKYTPHENTFKKMGRAIKPSNEEIRMNGRARSAILRVGEKIL